LTEPVDLNEDKSGQNTLGGKGRLRANFI